MDELDRILRNEKDYSAQHPNDACDETIED